jgi:hypothetical protein
MSSRRRVRNFFRRHKDEAQERITTSVLPLISREPNGQSNQATHPSTPIDLWQSALEKLGDKERTILSTIPVSMASNDNNKHPQVLASISEVIRLTEEQYEQSKVDRRI